MFFLPELQKEKLWRFFTKAPWTRRYETSWVVFAPPAPTWAQPSWRSWAAGPLSSGSHSSSTLSLEVAVRKCQVPSLNHFLHTHIHTHTHLNTECFYLLFKHFLKVLAKIHCLLRKMANSIFPLLFCTRIKLQKCFNVLFKIEYLAPTFPALYWSEI